MSGESSARAPLGVKTQLTGEYAMYAFGSIAILVWQGTPSIAGARQIHSAIKALHEASGRCSIVHLLNASTGLPNDEVRAEFGRLAASLDRALICTAILNERQGFVAGAIRAVLTGLFAVSSKQRKIRVFGTLEELLAWFLPLHREGSGEAVDASGLQTILQSLRSPLA